MTRRVRVGIHPFSTYPAHPGSDGVNLAYSDVYRLLERSASVEVLPHNILDIFADDQGALNVLRNCDVIVSTVGPHAYIYHYIRERLGLQMRIIRDVHTALWTSYLLQETLAAPYLRPEDSVIYPSAYSRDLFRALLPHVPWHTQHICYPLIHSFPPTTARRRFGRRTAPFTVGYVGRLTRDKNFHQALELLAQLNQLRSGYFRLLAIGQGSGRTGYSQRVYPRAMGRIHGYHWIPTVSWRAIWKHYFRDLDVLFFPSTSTIETLGRAIVEATYAGLPVMASNHGASAELLVPDALLETSYYGGSRFTTHRAAPLGEVDVHEAAARLVDGPVIPLSDGYRVYALDHHRLIELVTRGNDTETRPVSYASTPQQRSFISRVRMFGMARDRSSSATDRAVSAIRRRFVSLHRHYRPIYGVILLELLLRSRYRARTLQFCRRSIVDREDFTNIGGVDLELSNIIGLWPEFRLTEDRRSHGADGPADAYRGDNRPDR